ncbi:MAG: hypothetical protein WCH99_04915 [Verrucomicrobiota bacterium]
MKTKIRSLIILAAVALATVITSPAQTAPTNNIPNFITQVQTWATSVNTNYDWTNATLQVESGYKQATGQGAASYIAVQYDFQSGWNAGIEGQFYGVGSAFNSVEVQGGYTLIKNHDFKVEGNLLAGYDNTRSAFVVEPEIKAVKMLTINTYTTAGFSMPFFDKGKFDSSGQFKVGVGFFF